MRACATRAISSSGHATHGATATSNRLYAIASTPSLTSAYADHPVALRASDVEQAARRIATLLGMSVAAPDAIAGDSGAWLTACVRDLAAHRGASLVVAGDGQPPIVHALAHAMNAALGNAGATVDVYRTRSWRSPRARANRCAALARDMAARRVDTLVVIGGNPVYCAPARPRLRRARCASVAMTVRLGLHEDETSARCEWHLPATHSVRGVVRRARLRRHGHDPAAADRAALRGPFGARARCRCWSTACRAAVTRSCANSGSRGSARFRAGLERRRCATASSRTARCRGAAVTLRDDALAAPRCQRRAPRRREDTSLELFFVAGRIDVRRPLCEQRVAAGAAAAADEAHVGQRRARSRRRSPRACGLANEDVVELRHRGRKRRGAGVDHARTCRRRGHA